MQSEKIMVLFQPLSDEHRRQLRQIAPEYRLIDGREDNREDWVAAEIAFGWDSRLSPACLGPGSLLRWIQMWGAGVDKLPLDTIAAKNVKVTNASGVHAYPISETIVMMMLALTHRLPYSLERQAAREWKPIWKEELHGKTAGIFGMGAIGTETAKLAKAFGIRVLGVNRSGNSNLYADAMYRLDEKDEVLKESDYVIVTLPITSETFRLFGEAEFLRMKPGAYYINVGRGETTDEEALIVALRKGVIAGAGLDVFRTEPLPRDNPLWGMEQVIVTPHHSGATVHYERRAVDIFVRNLRDYIVEKTISVNLVDLTPHS